MKNAEALDHTLWAAFSIGLVHIVSGWLLITTPAVLNVTPLAELKGLVAPFAYIAPTNVLAGWSLIIAGALALTACLRGLNLSPLMRLALTAPQQVALLCQLISISVAVQSGRYPDGYEPAAGGRFILGDQLWAMSASLAHTFEAARLCILAVAARRRR